MFGRAADLPTPKYRLRKVGALLRPSREPSKSGFRSTGRSRRAARICRKQSIAIAVGCWARPRWAWQLPVSPTCFPQRSSCDRRRRHSSFPRQVPERGARRPAQAHRGDAVARSGNGRGCNAGRAARDDAEARALLGRRTTTGARCEARLNALPQFVTEIDGLDIHFIHVRSKHAECAADDRHARLARLDHRAAEDHRSADQSHGAWRRARRTRSTS